MTSIETSSMNYETIAAKIVSWIESKAEEARADSLILGVSGGIDSALVAALASRTKFPVYAATMPCNSNPSHVDRANIVMKEFKLNSFEIDLGEAFDSIVGQVKSMESANIDKKRACYGALRSCLRAPTLDYLGKIFNGIILGTGNKDEDYLIRYFQKRGDGAVDISPIADLHKSEVFELARYLKIPEIVLEAVPSADLWGESDDQSDEEELGISYQDVEFVSRLAEGNKIEARGEKMLEAFIEKGIVEDLTEKQKEVIRIVSKMEIVTRHKENPNLPVCSLVDIK